MQSQPSVLHFRFFEKYPEHKKLHKDLAKFDDDAKMKESNAFEMAAVGIFNTIDFVMQNSEDVDKALKNLKKFPCGKVRESAKPSSSNSQQKCGPTCKSP